MDKICSMKKSFGSASLNKFEESYDAESFLTKNITLIERERKEEPINFKKYLEDACFEKYWEQYLLCVNHGASHRQWEQFS